MWLLKRSAQYIERWFRTMKADSTLLIVVANVGNGGVCANLYEFSEGVGERVSFWVKLLSIPLINLIPISKTTQSLRYRITP